MGGGVKNIFSHAKNSWQFKNILLIILRGKFDDSSTVDF